MARLFCIFHALSFELNFFFDRRFPLKLSRYRSQIFFVKYEYQYVESKRDEFANMCLRSLRLIWRAGLTCCNLRLQHAMLPIHSMQSLQKVKPNPTCATVASLKKLRDKLQRGHVIRCNLSRNAIATQVAKKIDDSAKGGLTHFGNFLP